MTAKKMRSLVPVGIPLLLLLAPAVDAAEPRTQGEPAEQTAAAEEAPEQPDAEPEPAGDPVLMSGAWAGQACDAWNGTPELTDGLLKWLENDGDRGFKVIQIYRTDCAESEWVELRLAEKDGKVECSFGGWKETTDLAPGVDYVMHATTERWQQMGNGDFGPMGGMMTGRLKFSGPKWEAMKNMGPFGSFLRLVGKVPYDASACPL